VSVDLSLKFNRRNMNTTTSFEKGTIGETVYIDLSTV
jgi:hypothetical protein